MGLGLGNRGIRVVGVRLSSGVQGNARASCILKDRGVTAACQGGEAGMRNNGTQKFVKTSRSF